MIIEHLNPEGLHRNPAFTQVIAVSGPHKVVYVGGQNAVDARTGLVVGATDLREQTRQVFENLRTALAAAGAGLEHVVRWTVHVVQGQDPRPAFEVSQHEWGQRPNPPTISVLFVAGLANPEFLIEIDAVAVVADPPVEPGP